MAPAMATLVQAFRGSGSTLRLGGRHGALARGLRWRSRPALRAKKEEEGEEGWLEDVELPEPAHREDGLPPIPPQEERVMPRQVGEEDVEVKFVRSSGPGGQNVNKVSSKADVRLNVYRAGWLPSWVRDRLVAMQQNRVNQNGELVVQSDRQRTQKANLQDCLSKIQSYIDQAAYVPPEGDEGKKRKLKKKIKKAKERRLESKKQHSDKKKQRKMKKASLDD